MAMHRRLGSAALLSVAVLWVGIASVQVRAQVADGKAPPADPAPAAADPREEQRLRANDNDWFRAPARDEARADGPADFPARQVQDAVVANARAAEARAMFRRAESALAASVRQARRSFESSAELREAVAAEQRAHDAYAAARRDALQGVVADGRYRAMQDLRENLTKQIVDRRESTPDAYDQAMRLRLVSAGPRLDPDAVAQDRVVAMAELKMRVGSDARSMEREALVNNERVRQAQKELAAAAAKVAALRDEFDRKVREDAGLKKSREAMEDARVARVVAETYRRDSGRAADAALDFAYSLHRYDYYRYNRDYGYPYASFYGYPHRNLFGYGFASKRYHSVP